MMSQLEKTIYISTLALAVFGFGLPAFATINCTYGIDPTSGSVGDSCTVSVNCVDSTGSTEPTNSSCTGEFAPSGDYTFCVYNASSCSTASALDYTPGDITQYEKKGMLPLSGSYIFSSIKEAIVDNFARIIHL